MILFIPGPMRLLGSNTEEDASHQGVIRDRDKLPTQNILLINWTQKIGEKREVTVCVASQRSCHKLCFISEYKVKSSRVISDHVQPSREII